jgi:uncharacterized DUF497 family protein
VGPCEELCKPEGARVSFEQAESLFAAADYLEIFDEEHSESEERFIALA